MGADVLHNLLCEGKKKHKEVHAPSFFLSLFSFLHFLLFLSEDMGGCNSNRSCHQHPHHYWNLEF